MLSPRHPEVEAWVVGDGVRERARAAALRRLGAQRPRRRAVPVVDTGRSIPGPDGAELPVLVSPLVDARYGPTAALGIPAVDEADADDRRAASTASPGPTSRRPSRVAAAVGAAEAKRYRANDFSISRQRSWGTPIPIIHCERLRAGPGPRGDLPVVLPRDIAADRRRESARRAPDFVDVTCPRCGGAGRTRRPTPSTAISMRSGSGYRRRVPPADRAEQMFTHPDLRRWLPAERLVAGADWAASSSTSGSSPRRCATSARSPS